MIYHIVIGDMAATPLTEAMATTPGLAGEIIVIKDLLNLGPIQKIEEGQKFSDLRSTFWQQVTINDKNPIQVTDTERILQASAAMAADDTIQAWIWIAPWPADICTLLWVTKYFGKYPGRFFTVNIAGLPFLDENGKVFYPKNISELQPREVVKAKRLARPVSYVEIETDTEEWRKLTNENGAIRTLEGAKRIVSRAAEHYDAQLYSFCTQQYQKASKIINQAMAKHNIPTGDSYLGWRLREMAAAEKLNLQGDITKALKDFDVRIPSGQLEFGDETTTPTTANQKPA